MSKFCRIFIEIKVMNNKRWVYRIAKGSSFRNTGPYGYLAKKLYEQEGLTKEQIKPVKDLMYSKERWTGHVYEDNVNEVLSKYPVFKEYGCFSTYKVQRPGPWDDPVMKQNILNRFGSRMKLNGRRFKWTGFAFDSLEQLYKWFNDEKELKLLMNLGFKIHSEKVDQKSIVNGLKQIWILEE